VRAVSECLAFRRIAVLRVEEVEFGMSVSKIISVQQAAEEVERLRGSGRRLVFTNGCFDLLHVGHVRYLQAARERGDALLVAVNGDVSVRALKGPSRPINGEADRAEVLAALGCVDYVTLFYTPRVTELIRVVRPAVYVKGGDYTVDSLDPEEREALREVGSQVEILALVPGKSTTAVIHKLGASAL